MPEVIGKKVHIPISTAQFDEGTIRTIPIDAEQGISALYGKKQGSDERAIKTFLFDTEKGWTLESAQKWVRDHNTAMTQALFQSFATQQEQSLPSGLTDHLLSGLTNKKGIMTQQEQEDSSSLDIAEGVFEDPPDASKYISIRQHPPQHFTGYRHVPFHRTNAYHKDIDSKDSINGVWAALGVWKKTGARVIQKLHFERAKGWTEEKVKTWFQNHPTLYYPQSEGLFFALSDNSSEQQAIVVDHILATQYASDSIPEQIDNLEVIVIQGGWGKNRRRGPDGQMYQDFFPRRFLESLIPLLDETTVQSIKLSPESTGEMATIIKEVIQELQRHGHPDDIANLLFRYGFAGNSIGFLSRPAIQGLEDKTYPYVTARFLLSNTEAARDSKQLLQSAWKHGLDRALGLSINYRAAVSFGIIEGRPACIFEQATHHVSTELVPNPAAGGKILRPGISAVSVVQQDGEDTMADKKERQQESTDDVTLQKDTSPVDNTPPDDHVVAAQSTQSPHQDLQAESEEDKATSYVASQGEKHENPAQQADMAGIDARIAQIMQTVDTLAGSVQGLITRQGQDDLTAIVTQAENVPAPAQTKILEQIAGGLLKTPEQVRAMVSVVQSATPAKEEDPPPAPLFRGMSVQSATRAEVTRDRKDVMKIRSYLLWGLPLTQSEQALAEKYRIRKFLSMKDEYIQLTGDHELNFNGLNPDTFIQNVHPDTVLHSPRFRGLMDEVAPNYAQTILTTTYSDFLTHILNRTLEIHFMNQDKTWQRVVRMGESYSDNRDHTHFLLGQFPEIDTVAQGGSYTEMGSGKLASVTSSNVKKGNLWKVSEETIQDDDLEYVKNSVMQIAMAANRTMEHLVWNMIFAASGGSFNGDTMSDSIAGALYSYANRRNYINGEITDYTKVVELIQLMLTQTDLLDDDGTTAPMTMMPYLFIGNVQEIGKIRALAKTTTEAGRTDGLLNQFYMLNNLPDENFIGVHPQYMLDHPEFLGILPNPANVAGVVLKYFRGLETPEFIWEGNQAPAYGQAFASDTLQLRVKFKYRLYYYKLKAFHGMFLDA